MEMMTESELRALVKLVFDRIARACDELDPDLLECELSQGSLTLLLAGGAKWIVSVQTPVRQIWLAVASIGKAYHFNYDPVGKIWRDDKDGGIELMSHLEKLLDEVAGLKVSF